ncbi:MAG TPA: ribosome silencing factor [Spirochaetia bacterium]|nr:ribosome silencing factor [Spirochaetia bacterium]
MAASSSSSNSNSRETVIEAARLLSDAKGEDTVVLSIGEISAFADYFIITTARSSAHLAGLMRELAVFLHARGIRPAGHHKRAPGKGWHLLDCGDFVIHLMEKEQRDFYDLERLWFRAERISYWSKSS